MADHSSSVRRASGGRSPDRRNVVLRNGSQVLDVGQVGLDKVGTAFAGGGGEIVEAEAAHALEGLKDSVLAGGRGVGRDLDGK